jgi:hypothetical protein
MEVFSQGLLKFSCADNSVQKCHSYLIEGTADVVIPRDDPFDRISDKVNVNRIHQIRIQFRKIQKVLMFQKSSILKLG